MATPVPRKKKPKADAIEAKAEPTTEEKHADLILEQSKLFEAATNARFRIARAAYDYQDDETQRVADIICERLRTAGSGYIRIYPNGKRNPSIAVPITLEQQDQNILFIAMEILKDLALFDVKVAAYKFPPVYCASCGDKLKGGE